jgi:hypothetical protein
MHPKIDFPGNLAPLFADLSRPLYERSLFDPTRRAVSGREVSLESGYTLHPQEFPGDKYLDLVLEDFHRFMSVAMERSATVRGYPIRLRHAAVAGRPEDAAEAHAIEISADGCEVIAEDLEGLRRAMFRLQDEMRTRRAPILPIGREARWTRVKTRIGRSTVAPYRWLSGWELADEHDY